MNKRPEIDDMCYTVMRQLCVIDIRQAIFSNNILINFKSNLTRSFELATVHSSALNPEEEP